MVNKDFQHSVRFAAVRRGLCRRRYASSTRQDVEEQDSVDRQPQVHSSVSSTESCRPRSDHRRHSQLNVIRCRPRPTVAPPSRRGRVPYYSRRRTTRRLTAATHPSTGTATVRCPAVLLLVWFLMIL